MSGSSDARFPSGKTGGSALGWSSLIFCRVSGVDGAMPWRKYMEFEARGVVRGLRERRQEEVEAAGADEVGAGKARLKRQGKHWYTRHHMWLAAQEVRGRPEYQERGPVAGVDDLGNDEKFEALKWVREMLSRNKHLRCSHEGEEYVEQGRGAATVGDLENEALANYNGTGGGKVWTYYQPEVFNEELRKQGVDVQTCTERQCFRALRATSARLRKCGEVWKKDLVPDAGPQCYPQLKEVERLEANSQKLRVAGRALQVEA